VPPPAPSAQPASIAELDDTAPDQFASAEGRAEFSAKAQASADIADDADEPGTRRAARFARSISYRVSMSSDEAQILRERAAWLRSLDRKYGITH
jgi:hypothetical protein